MTGAHVVVSNTVLFKQSNSKDSMLCLLELTIPATRIKSSQSNNMADTRSLFDVAS